VESLGRFVGAQLMGDVGEAASLEAGVVEQYKERPIRCRQLGRLILPNHSKGVVPRYAEP